MIRILFEEKGVVMTFDSKDEIDLVIDAVKSKKYDGVGPNTIGGMVRFLDQKHPDAIAKTLKTLREYKGGPGKSYPALAYWCDDSIDPEYQDKLTDEVIKMAQSMYTKP